MPTRATNSKRQKPDDAAGGANLLPPAGFAFASTSFCPAQSGSRRETRAFTLVEVLAALALMAIIVPVAMQGVQIASRAGTLGERKATAMRIAESVLNELIVTGEMIQSTASGNVTENGLSYPWTMKSETWSEDAMNVVTVQVIFTVQGDTYNVSASTLYDPTTSGITSTSSSTAAKTSP